MFSITGARYFLYGQPTDMRKSFDGLCGLVLNELGQNPVSGDVFVFINRTRNHLKLLRWEAGGYVLFYKRLEAGTFELPAWKVIHSGKQVEYAELVMMITGIPLTNARKRKRFLPQNAV
jgi:transposase